METPRTRFGINPGPLKIVKRKALADPLELAESVRCRAIKPDGERCTRIQTNDSVYCWQHQHNAR